MNREHMPDRIGAASQRRRQFTEDVIPPSPDGFAQVALNWCEDVTERFLSQLAVIGVLNTVQAAGTDSERAVIIPLFPVRRFQQEPAGLSHFQVFCGRTTPLPFDDEAAEIFAHCDRAPIALSFVRSCVG